MEPLSLSLSLCLSQTHMHFHTHTILSVLHTPKPLSFVHVVLLPRVPSLHLANFFHPSEGSSNVTSSVTHLPTLTPSAPHPLAGSRAPL